MVNISKNSLSSLSLVYSVEGTSTVTTLDSTSLLVGVNVGELTTGSLDNLDTVGTGGVRVLTTVRQALDHFDGLELMDGWEGRGLESLVTILL